MPDLHKLGCLLNAATMEAATWGVFAIQPFATDLITAWRRWFRYDLVWRKRRAVGFLNANRQPMRSHELLLIFGRAKSQALYHPQKIAGKPYRSRQGGKTPLYSTARLNQVTVNTGDRHPRSVLEFDESNRGKIHPTQKPLALLEWLVRSYTAPGDLVIDPFAGSATTAVACLRTGRRCIAIEKDPEIFARARSRLETELASPAAQ